MKCQKCGENFEEHLIEESHDVPCYLFWGDKRNIKKNQADKHGRHNLCHECHKKYEYLVNLSMKLAAIKFSQGFFKDDNSI